MNEEHEAPYSLKILRRKNDLTIRELADQAGVSFGHLGQWENGNEMMSKETAKKLAGPLEVDWKDLFALQLNNAARSRLEDIKSDYKEGKYSKREVEAELYKLLWTISDRQLEHVEMSSELNTINEETIQQIHEFLKQI